ncbi:MAG TPA: hypothetical protein VNH11_10130 [Pirellulales bacterium]|nr:hypothetical protein [Pirellulales bacterium]
MNRLHALVVAHLAAGIALSWAARVYPTTAMGVSLASVFFGQCALLAVWAGFSAAPQLWRYIKVGRGGTYLWLIVTIARPVFAWCERM